MPEDLTFNTPAGQTIDRELLVAYLNTGTASAPVWSPLGRRSTDSSMEYDMAKDTVQDIMGDTYTTLKKPVITQTFDPLPMDAADDAIAHIWNLGVYHQNVQALANQDILVAHLYADSGSAKFAERYPNSAVSISSLGGEGGGNIGMPIEVTFGGTRQLGTVAKDTDGTVTFTPSES